MFKLDSVSVAYGAIQAVKGVSLEVRKGEVVTLLGANGAGKSSLLKAVVGIEPLQSGKIFIDGQDVSNMPAHKRLGVGVSLSPEGRGVFADQSVEDNLILGAYSKKYDKDTLAGLIEKEFQRFPRLRERRQQLAGTLSGGEQQMLAISRALMSQPKLLLLDEPSLGLAPLIIKDIFKQIKMLQQEGLTILLVEQMANQALAVSDRGYVLETGKVTLSGTGKELLNNQKVRSAYLGGH